jgi:hypothetical protein
VHGPPFPSPGMAPCSRIKRQAAQRARLGGSTATVKTLAAPDNSTEAARRRENSLAPVSPRWKTNRSVIPDKETAIGTFG